MRTLLAAVAAGAATLAFAGPALADTHELLVTPFVATPAAKSTVDVELALPTTAAAAARIQLYVPQGYGVAMPAPGTNLGDATATLSVSGVAVQAAGQVVADDPAKYAADPTAQACAPGTHAGVWVVQLTANGQSLSIPLYVDPATGADAALGGTVVQGCLPSPDVPADQGGAPLGAKLADVDLELAGVLTNPGAGVPVWRAIVTPYVAGTGTPDPAHAIEVRCDVPLPHTVSGLKAIYSKKTKKVTITGRLLAAGKPRPGVHVRIDAGTKPAADSLKAWAVATTNAQGAFTIVKPLKGTLYGLVYVNPYFEPCSGTSTAPGGCEREDIAAEYGPEIVLHTK